MIRDSEDAYGHEIYDYYKGKNEFEVVERDDGYIDPGSYIKMYFADFKDWPESEKKAMRFVRGRVLDVGCGAGRHALYLQGKGHDVLAVDNSPNALKTAEERGVEKTKLLSVTQVDSSLGEFDSIIMMGNNLSLMGNPKRAKWLFKRFHSITTEKGRIVGMTRDPYWGDIAEHREYHEFNRRRGRMAGQVRIRIRYKKYIGRWFDYYFVSKEELEGLLEGTGWCPLKYIDGEAGMYIAVIEKENR